MSRDTIDLKRVYVDICGRLNSGVLLSQLIYYFLPVRDDKDGTFKQHWKLVEYLGENWVPMRRNEWWNAARLREDEVDTVLRECGIEMDGDGRFKVQKVTRRRPKLESRNLIVYRSTLLENSNKKTHILRPNWPVFLAALDDQVNNYQIGWSDTPSPDEIESDEVDVSECERSAETENGLNPKSVSDNDEEIQNRKRIEAEIGFGSDSKPISDPTQLPHIEEMTEGFKTSTQQPTSVADGDVNLSPSSSPSPDRLTPPKFEPPLPGLAGVSIALEPSGEPTHTEGLARRFSEWATTEGKKIDSAQIERIITRSTLAASDVAEMQESDLIARIRDFKALKMRERIHGKNYLCLIRDVEFLRWLLWLWPMHLRALDIEDPGKNIPRTAAFVHRAGFGKDGRGALDISLPKLEWLEALIREDNARLAAANRARRDEQAARDAIAENARVEALNIQLRSLSDDDRRALHREVVAGMPDAEKFAEKFVEAGFNDLSPAILSLMRHKLSEGWNPDAYRAAARFLAHDAPTSEIEAALARLDDGKRAHVEAEARRGTQEMNMSPKVLETVLKTRRVSAMRVEIKAGRLKIPLATGGEQETEQEQAA